MGYALLFHCMFYYLNKSRCLYIHFIRGHIRVVANFVRVRNIPSEKEVPTDLQIT